LVPALSVPAGIVKLAVPLEREFCWLYGPLARVTVPVGVGCPLLPATETVITRLCWSVIVEAAELTVTVEAPVPTIVTVTVAD
jgi:hypothetical protein